MRTYFIYLIEEEVADYFYGREMKLYGLFAAKQSVRGEMQEIVKKQIQFITKPLPYHELHCHLSLSVQKKAIYMKDKSYYIDVANGKRHAKLTIAKRHLELHAVGDFEAESVFFEVLRGFNGRLLAIDIENDRYGWINTVKARKYV